VLTGAYLLCSLYNNIRTPSQLQPSATYYLFKEHIEPKWEDPKNVHGGCWTANIPKTATSKQTLDTWWLHSVRPAAAARLPLLCTESMLGPQRLLSIAQLPTTISAFARAALQPVETSLIVLNLVRLIN
jgi:hypothetical protein